MSLQRLAIGVPALGASLVALLVVVAADPAASQGASSAQVKRGGYLTTMMGCQDCHTPGFFYGAPDASRQLSGSEVGWKGPWGVSYPANLTPDRATGLGTWTDEQIIAAIRTGVRPDKRRLNPPMPWQSFSQMTDEDVRAIVAYLRSIPAVPHEEPKPAPPGVEVAGAVLVVPPPPAWDAPKQPAPVEKSMGR